MVGIFGVSFGVLARTAHLGPIATVVMSATVFGGSAQFAAVAVLAGGGGLVSAVVAAALLNARYVPIGVSIAHVLHPRAWRRLLEAQLVVDESWALGNRDGGPHRAVLLGAGALIYSAWVAGTVGGVVAGSWVGNPARFGLDAAFPALFLALLWSQATTSRARLVAVLGATIAIAMTPFFPAGVPVVAASLACLLGLRR